MEAQHKSRKEEHEMLVASYDFDATIPQTLSFKKDDNFIFHSTNNIKKNWWSIIDAHGKVGYIPSNYVSIVKIKKGKMIDFINTAIENLSADISKAGGSDKQLEAMKELILRKQETLQKRSRSRDNSEKREKLSCSKSLPDSDSVHSTGEDGADGSSPKPATAPLVMRVSVSESKFPSSEGQSSSESRSESASQQITKKRRAPPAPDNSSGSYQSLESVLRLADSPEAPHSKKTSSGDVSSQSIYLLVHQVRNQTGLSHDSARIATGVVVEGLLDILPSEASGSLESFLELLHANVPPPESVYDDTQDAIELRGIISHLRTAREDAQQRSWHLWDDEDSIQQHIGALSSILKNADPAISRRVLRQGNYDDIMMLVDYYQMEERVCIRQLLIDTFAVLCGLDEVIISIILNSVLPMELAREMQSNRNKCSEIEKQAMLLAYIFSLGEAMPITHLDHLGCDFITMVLEIIESDSAADIDDAMVMLILSYNLQFKPKSSTNITLQALSEMESAKNFTEKIMLLINREEDPIQRLDVHHPPYHSVLKLLKDVFFSPSTAKLFYTNDIKVLIEIILRQMTNLAPNSKQRTEYLELCRLVLFSCEDATFEHRLSELKSLFNYIINEEAPGVPQDKNIARQVIEGLPQHFG
ncbi:Protein of unknown function (DUF2013) [Nesidiocoris tenuis]|uniref:SH3 domain-containing protein n=1 Tax=Nesidiocoris tenuis TaxID=355587 RepID=A0ABN7ASK7_9HEMI|nr:Protein of unknown function (DUF2013) [Nesidiocoris tenuis]